MAVVPLPELDKLAHDLARERHGADEKIAVDNSIENST